MLAEPRPPTSSPSASPRSRFSSSFRRVPAPGCGLPSSGAPPRPRSCCRTCKAIRSCSLRGRPVLVNFFATWCPPCRAELPELQALAEAHPDCLQILGIAQETEGASKIAAFAKERGITYPLLLDDGGAGASYSVTSIPRSVLIDADGNVAGIADGTVTKAGVERRFTPSQESRGAAETLSV